MVKENEIKKLKEKKYSIQNEKIKNPLLKGRIDDLMAHYDSNEELRMKYVKDISLIESENHYVVEVELNDRENLSHIANRAYNMDKLHHGDQEKVMNDVHTKFPYLSANIYPGGLSHVLGAECGSDLDAYHNDKSLEEILATEYDRARHGKKDDIMYLCDPINPWYEQHGNDNMLIFNVDSFEDKLNSLTQDLFGLDAKEYMNNNLKDIINSHPNSINYLGNSYKNQYDWRFKKNDCIHFKRLVSWLGPMGGKYTARGDQIESIKSESLEDYNKLFPFKDGVSEEEKNPKRLQGFLNLAFYQTNKYLKLVRNDASYGDHFRHFASKIEKRVDDRHDLLEEEEFYTFLSAEDISRYEESGIQLTQKEWEYHPEDSHDSYGIYFAVRSKANPLRLGDASVILSKGMLGKETLNNQKARVLHLYKKSDLKRI